MDFFVWLFSIIILNMSKLKLAIFDMDGTLIDTEYTMWYHSKKTGFESLGYPYDDEFGDSMCGMNQANITKLILNRYPDFPIDEYWKIIKRENDLFLRTKEVPVIDGVFEILDYCKEKGICVEAWSPIGSGRLLENELLKNIAEKYNKSVAQLCIRWCLQNGTLPLPKSVTPSRIIENTKIFDFSITAEDMEAINAMEYCGGSGHHPDKVKF